MALKIPRGRSFSFGYTHKKDGVISSLAGCTLYLTIKQVEYDSDATDSSAIIKQTLTSFTDPTNGYTAITLSDTDTAYKAGTTTFIDPEQDYYMDISVKEADGHTYEREKQTVKFTGSATNRNLS